MSSKFTISLGTPLRWPNKCAICEENATTTYTAHGGAFERISYMIILTEIKTKKPGVTYPICLKHKYITMLIRMLYFISFLAMLYSGLVALVLYTKGPVVSSLALAIFLISAITFIASVKWQPVRLRVGHHSLTLVIRNDQYAREFSLFNNL